MTPYELVTSKYKLPFDLYPFQQDGVNKLATLEGAGYYFDVGCGKSATSTASDLYMKIVDGRSVVAVMPPILTRMWKRWLDSIPGVTSVIYEGSPARRKGLDINVDYLLMSIQVFKNDYEYLAEKLKGRRLVLKVDEATSIKNVGSANHKAIRGFRDGMGAHLQLLTGTPLSTPIDAYAYCKLITPGTYRNLHQFENIHVGERDFFGKVTKWNNLDLLHENMKINSVRVLRHEVLKDLPAETYTPIFYDLEPKHYRLYKELAEQQLLKLQNGGKIDATTPNKLYYALQQIVVNWGHFAGDPTLEPRALELVEEVLSELGDRKLIVVAIYQMTNRMLIEKLSKYGAVGVYGEISPRQQSINVDKFIRDKDCRVLVIQPSSGGYGIDGIQHVCQDMLMIELPAVPRDFHQVVARLHRNGQKGNVNIRVAVADRTLQVRKLNDILAKDQLVNRVQGGWQDLKDMLFGG